MTTPPRNFGARYGNSHSVSGLSWRDWLYTSDCFDRGLSRQAWGSAYDIATLSVGGGSNEVTSNVSRNTLITGAVANNQEGTQIHDAVVVRSRQYYAEVEVELTSVTAVEFRFGFYKDADEYAFIEFDKSLNDNWRLHIDDGSGAEFSTESLVVQADEDYFMAIWMELDGTPHWAIGASSYYDMVEMGTTGIANKVTADPHFLQWYVKTEENVAKTAKIDYLRTYKTANH